MKALEVFQAPAAVVGAVIVVAVEVVNSLVWVAVGREQNPVYC